jgi:15-cis-phytoene desaturase
VSERPHAVVLGAGVAGLTAALELARREMRVTVVEAAPVAGGRAGSWTDERGRVVDPGFHVVADHHVNLLDVMGQLGLTRRLRWFHETLFLDPMRAPVRWRFDAAPSPLHLMGPILRGAPSLGEALRAGAAGLELFSYSAAELGQLDDIPYLEWHRRHRLGAGYLRLAETGADAAAFTPIERVSLRAVAYWLLTMSRHQRASDLAVFDGPLGEALVAPLVRSLEARGGHVAMSTAAVGIHTRDGRISSIEVCRCAAREPVRGAALPVVGPSRALPADLVVCALPVQALSTLLGEPLARAAGVAPALQLGTVPAIGLTLWLDRPVRPALRAPAVVLGSSVRTAFDRSTVEGSGNEAHRPSVYECIVAGGEARWHWEDERIVAEALADLRRAWGLPRRVGVMDHAVRRTEAAMFDAVPGAHQARPAAVTGIDNLFLAGDYTLTDGNPSMEGAVLSGRRAASAALRRHGQPETGLRGRSESSFGRAWQATGAWLRHRKAQATR